LTFISLVAVFFLVGSLVLIVVVRSTLTASATSRVETQVARAQAFAARHTLLDADFKSGGGVAIQVIDRTQRRVWASSPNLEGAPPLASVRHPESDSGLWRITLHATAGTKPFLTELSQPFAAPVSTTRGQGYILGFYDGPPVSASVRHLTWVLLASLPVVLALLGLLIWLGLGLTLAPVESIRRRVSAIAGSDLSQRVPEMPGDDEIARLSRTLNAMLARLEAASHGHQEFVSNASHELRSPLTTLLMTVDQAAHRPDEANWESVADTVAREGRRLQQLIDDLFWLARADEKGHPFTPVDVDLDDVLFDEATRLRTVTALAVESRGVAPVRVRGDLDMLRRLVRNIVDNAARYATSTVTLTVRTEGGEAVLTVADDGPGVDPDTADRLFGRFARADESRSRSRGGTGLGLAIVAEIAERHQGTARFVPGGSGATVEVRLPRERRGDMA
jgi:signal transduction histidine kinase